MYSLIKQHITQGNYSAAEEMLGDLDDEGSTILKGIIAERRGRYKEALALAREVYERTKDKILKLKAIVGMSYALWRVDRLVEAKELITEGMEIIEGEEECPEIMESLGELFYVRGIINDIQNNLSESQSDFEKSLELRKKIGDAAMISHSLNALGLSAEATGDTKNAVDYFLQSLDIKRQLGNFQDIARTLNNLANNYTIMGEYDLAEEHLIETIALFRQYGSKRDTIVSLGSMGKLLRAEERYDEAKDMFIEAYMLAKEEDIPDMRWVTTQQLVGLYVSIGQRDVAEEYLNEMEAIVRRTENQIAHHEFKLTKALFEKNSKRLSNKMKGQELLKELISTHGVRPSILERAYFAMVELLLHELAYSGEEEIISEIHTYLQNIEELVNGTSIIERARLLTFRGKFELIQGNAPKGFSHMYNALNIAEMKGYDSLARFIFKEIETVMPEMNKLSIRERAQLIDTSKLLTSMTQNAVPRISKKRDTPLFLFFTDHGGTVKFSLSFNSGIEINEFLVGAYITAITNFSTEVFKQASPDIQRIEYGNYSILVCKEEKGLVGYIYKGDTYSALQRMKEFMVKYGTNSREIGQVTSENISVEG